jgi:hypothetical protein
MENTMSLIKVTKDGQELEIHETALVQHMELGWKPVPEPVEAEQKEKTLADFSYAELKAFLTENGVEYPSNIKKDEALALALEVKPKEA